MLGQLAVGQLIQSNPTDFVCFTGQAAITCFSGKARMLKIPKIQKKLVLAVAHFGFSNWSIFEMFLSF